MSGTKSKHGDHHRHGKDTHGHHAPPKHLDEVLEQLAHEHVEKLDDAVKAHTEFTSEDNTNHYFNNIFTPAHDKMYEAIVKGLDELGKGEHGHGDTTKTHGKHKDLKKVVAKGLKEYFNKVQPSIVKALDDLKLDEEDQYEVLVNEYDTHTGDGKIKGIDKLSDVIEDYARDKKATFGNLKKQLRLRQAPHTNAAVGILQNKHYNHRFMNYHAPELAGYFKERIEKSGLEIVDAGKFVTQTKEQFLHILQGLEEGQWGEGGYSKYGLGKKGTKEKLKAEEAEHGHDH
jgi:hypothetical protein